jgi:3-methyl-2-oxobutanoate hydroxymethyltransferase
MQALKGKGVCFSYFFKERIMTRKQVTIPDLYQKKASQEKISVLTAYDYPTAALCEAAGVEVVLVGDSLGNVMLGQGSTVGVTMDDMLHHIKAVRRGLIVLLFDRRHAVHELSDQPRAGSHQRGPHDAGRRLRLRQAGGRRGNGLHG